jgi:hypothetical protein
MKTNCKTCYRRELCLGDGTLNPTLDGCRDYSEDKTGPTEEPLPLARAMRAETQAKDAELSRLRAEVGALRHDRDLHRDLSESLKMALRMPGTGNYVEYAAWLCAEVERLTAALAAEALAVERLAGELAAGPAETPCNSGNGQEYIDKCNGKCAACWASWARQKEVCDGKGND